MSRKTLTAVGLAVCLAVVFVAIHAAERTRRAGDRSQRAKTPVKKVDLAQSYNPAFDPNAAVPSNATEAPDNPIELPQGGVRSAVVDGRAALAKATQLLRRSEKLEGPQAIATLRKVFDLKLDATPESARILADTNLKLAALFDEPSRKNAHLVTAYQYTTDAAARAEIESQLRANGGSLPSSSGASSTRAYGPDDDCRTAIPVALPGTVTMSLAAPIFQPGTDPLVDKNILTFDVPFREPGNPHQPLIGSIVLIETTSDFCDTEAECSTNEFDTAVNLYALCDEGSGLLANRVAEDEGPGDAGLGWLAQIEGRGTCFDETGRHTSEACFVDSDCQASHGGPNSHAFCSSALCLPAGTYWIEAKGDFLNHPDNFKVSVSELGTCAVPRGDSYEVDNSSPVANRIGSANSGPDQAGGFGKANKETQSHTVLANGPGTVDQDWVKFQFSRDEMLRLTTGVTLPRPNNGYFYRPASGESDTFLSMLYTHEDLAEGGVCNLATSRTILPAGAASFAGRSCRSSETNFGVPGLGQDDENRCGPPGSFTATADKRFFGGAVPGSYCVPMYATNVAGWLDNFGSGVQLVPKENPLVTHDNNDPASGDMGSTIELCLPKNGEFINDANFPLAFKNTTSPANQRGPILNYFYEMRGQPLSPCNYEREPNQSPFQATPFTFGVDNFGMFDTNDTKLTKAVPVGRCSTTTSQRCYLAPLPPGGTQISTATIPLSCPSGQTCTTPIREMASVQAGFWDFDWHGPFNVTELSESIFRLVPQIIDPDADTSLSIRIGPCDTDADGFDDFVVAYSDENTSESLPPSEIKIDLPPAAEFAAENDLSCSNPVYYMVAGILTNRGDAGSSIPNFYYSLSGVAVPPTPETEPNNDCLTTPQVAELNKTWIGSFFPSGGIRLAFTNPGQFGDCDIDAYRITITENTRISFSTSGDPALTDTAIRISNCDTGTVVACDEDGQYGINGTYWSLLEGCLTAGNYCVEARPWAGFGVEFGLNEVYKLKFAGTPGCDPDSDPVVGDEAGSCRVSSLGNAAPFDAGCDGDGDGYPARNACGVPLP